MNVSDLDVLFGSSDDAFAHEESIVIEKSGVFLGILFALVQEETDATLLQDVPQFSKEHGAE